MPAKRKWHQAKSGPSTSLRDDRERAERDPAAHFLRGVDVIWADWMRSRVRFLQYMGHGKMESEKIAKGEMARLRNSK